MTNRTASLLLLFVIGLGLTGMLLAAIIAAFGPSAASPWIAPAVASLCATTVLHLGRQYILPPHLVDEITRAVFTLWVIVSVALVAALGSVWLLERSVGRLMNVPSVIVPLWFGFLWMLVRRQHVRRGSLV